MIDARDTVIPVVKWAESLDTFYVVEVSFTLSKRCQDEGTFTKMHLEIDVGERDAETSSHNNVDQNKWF